MLTSCCSYIYVAKSVVFYEIHSLTSPCLFQTTHFQHLFLLKILELQLLCFLLYLQRQSWFILQSVLLLLQILLLFSSQINKLIKHFQVNTVIILLHPLHHVNILIVLLPPFPNRILMYPWFRYPSSLFLPLLNRPLLLCLHFLLIISRNNMLYLSYYHLHIQCRPDQNLVYSNPSFL